MLLLKLSSSLSGELELTETVLGVAVVAKLGTMETGVPGVELLRQAEKS
jgi:hypothetical protein